MPIQNLAPNKRAQRARLLLLCIVLFVLTVLGYLGYLVFPKGIPNPISLFQQSNSTRKPDSSTSRAPDGELIGISNGSYAFDTSLPDGALKTAASAAFRQGDMKTAISDWNAAHAQNSNDAEPLIYLEDQRVIASKAPYITFVVGTMLTDTAANMVNGSSSTVSEGRDELQGAYVAQITYNQGHLLPGGLQVVLLIANAGGNSNYVTGIAKQVVQVASHDSHVVGVMGWAFSAYALAASSVLGPAHIPMMSSAASSDALSDKPYFLRVVPPNSVQAIAGAIYAEQQLQAKTAAVFVDPKNSYSSTLATDFSNRFTQDGNQVVKTEDYTVKQTSQFPSELQDALQANVDLIYFAGYSDDMSVLLTDIGNLQASSLPRIMGGDALYIVKGYQPTSTANFPRLNFTTFAYPDEWTYERILQQPPFFVTYAHTYDPNRLHGNDPYTYDRPDDGAILAYDAVLTLLQGSINALSVHSNSAVTPTTLYQGLSMITIANPVMGVSGRIAFNTSSSTPSDPVDKAIVVLSVDSQGQIHLTGPGSIQGCYRC